MAKKDEEGEGGSVKWSPADDTPEFELELDLRQSLPVTTTKSKMSGPGLADPMVGGINLSRCSTLLIYRKINTPNNETKVFPCGDDISIRITPHNSNTGYVFDFALHDGTRTPVPSHLRLWDVSDPANPVRCPSLGEALYNAPWFYIAENRIYEIRARPDGRVIKRISFPRSLVVY
jgi:hypothetical protein